ncbi:Lipopolysaccharide biosynthesis protein [Dyella sp. OK004]|uniref:glycoside hydrolase family 99-like domain-containing protein n=1 Tax=Dyella sp. OK004 TaxID=1855292 RepID=UPI0008F2C80A|nr:glycoside hydrolase family 99-like domain-containing protein [Dyella sp. OK004]SFS07795.1 Lipopolysaccharide biosynthesis protein [Dyella sp. OK004]
MPLFDFAKRQVFQLLRVGFRLVPMPVATRDRWRQRFLDRYAGLVPAPPLGRAPIGGARRPLQRAAGHAVGYIPYRKGMLPPQLPATLVAFYLPQFHPIPENDAWWGAGFTEWRNVTRALPQFEGHAQPRLPGELGFYDLRQPAVMRRQMELAREYGVGAFCTYFYWFAGKTLLETPLRHWLSYAELDLPICLCWANENWSRRWDGRADDVLIGQQHSAEDDIAFISHVAAYLRDPRYLRVDGKPMLLVYRPGLLPSPKDTAARWRTWCKENGIGDIHLAYVQSFDRVDPSNIGFDAAVEFPPNNVSLPSITATQQLINPAFAGEVLDWRELANSAMRTSTPTYPLYPGVNPSWDNEPRRSGRGRVLAHASPRGYRDWLRHAVDVANARAPRAPMVFINAWNEWAEGAVLEPDTRLGYAWLEATRAALLEPRRNIDPRPCVVVHVWYVNVLNDIAAQLRSTPVSWRIILTTATGLESQVRERLNALNLDAELDVFENRGRDVLPFLHVADRLLNEGVDIVLKLHTKQSVHRGDGSQWRNELLHALAAPDRVPRIMDAFAANPRLGLVAPEGHSQPLDHFWGANESNIRALCVRLGIPQPAPGAEFVAGSMFWVRLSALRPLLDAHLEPWEFDAETGQIDGTTAHAVERAFSLATSAAGFESVDAARVCGLPSDGPQGPYPYARRSV